MQQNTIVNDYQILYCCINKTLFSLTYKHYSRGPTELYSHAIALLYIILKLNYIKKFGDVKLKIIL